MIPSVADALAAVPHTPALRVPQVVNLQRLEAAINGCQQPQLRQAMRCAIRAAQLQTL